MYNFGFKVVVTVTVIYRL